MVLPDPRQKLEAGVFSLVEDQVEQHRGHPLVLEHITSLLRGGGNRRSVTEVVQVDPKLLEHGGLVLDHEDRGAEYVRRPVHLQAGRERRQAHLALPGVAS